MSDLPNEELSELLHRAARRDEAAARAVVESLGPMVRRIVNGHPALRLEADDVMQDAFFGIFRSAVQYRGDAPVTHWAARITRFTCIARLRRRQRTAAEIRWSDLPEAQQALLTEGYSADEPPSVTAGEDAAALLETLFARLQPLDAWLLREVELRQRTHAEVAAEAGWNTVLLRVRLFRARRRLQTAFENLQSTSR